MSSGMDSKRRQQQQVCVPALHPQQMGAPCGAAPLGYPASPWVLWDAGQLMEAAARRRKKKRRLYAACLLAGVAFVVLAVAAIAGVAVYLAGTPPTESSGANWESFRRVGEATKYGDEASNRRGVLGRHGVLVLPPPSTERTTVAPARSPWSIRREGSPWEGRGQQGDDPAPPRANEGASAEEDGGELAAIEEGEEEGLEDLSGGVPEVAVVLDSEELEPVGDGSEAVEKVQGNPGHRSPHARASAKGTEAAPPAREETKASRPPPLSMSVEYATSISVEESPVKGPKDDGAQEGGGGG
ncbi:uncharacterized protein LOC124153225 [Ischnura elegans]|uniref:uncharacterized protein LOC124153225 n=1 Tax=Ischnura elegans TaxID=197161 RepID=UPI001ED884D8|nr:uncharacterized protein LOC124153225 [Ischnura elegans]